MPSATPVVTKGTYAPGKERREQLLSAVLRLIAQEGAAGVTHRAVAEAAGVSLGSTTYYFKTKDDMIRSAFGYYARRMEEVMDSVAVGRDTADLTIDTLVERVATIMLREFDDPDAMLLAEFELALSIAREPSYATEYRAIQENFERRLQGMLRALGSTSPTQHARIVLAVSRGYEFGWFIQPEARPSERTLRADLKEIISSLIPSAT